MSDFLPQFGNAGFTILAFVVALSVIVAIHEYGHYIIGRWSGIHAEVFSLGFGPVLFSRVDRRGTRWQFAAIPLGGYVKFLGDANAASAGGTAGGRNTMLGAPLWARASTVAAGPAFNFIFSFMVFAALIMFYGRASEPLTLANLPDLPPSYTQELRSGDQVLTIGGLPATSAESFYDAIDKLPLEATLDYEIRRDGKDMVVSGPYPETTLILSVNPGSAAGDAGLVKGDVIAAINGENVWAFDQMVAIVSASNGAPLALDVWREGQMLPVTLSPRSVDLPKADGSFETRWLMGVNGGLFFEPMTEFPGVFASFKSSVQQIWYIVKVSISGMYHMIAGKISTCNLSSPVGIAQASGAMAAAGILDFVQFMAVLSAAIGLLNLFPIPVLDGGHLVFHAYEAVTGQKPAAWALRLLYAAGLTLIVGMMALALMNDLYLCP